MVRTVEKPLESERLKIFIEDYLRQRGLPVRKAFRCLSPDHDDRHPSMSYNARANNVHCFACGVTYDLFDLVGMDYGLNSFMEKYEKVCELFGVGVEAKPVPVKSDQEIAEYDGMNVVPIYVVSAPAAKGFINRADELEIIRRQSDGDISYFLSRSISAESCKKYGLFQHGDRAYFPVFEGGKTTGWCARAIKPGIEPRYKNSAGLLGLWNGDCLLKSKMCDKIFITEGIIDAICIEQIGEKSLALCGSQNVKKLLRRCEQNLDAVKGKKFVVCGDPDTAGQRMNKETIEGLRGLGLDCTIMPLDSDTGDIGQAYINDKDKLLNMIAGIGKPQELKETVTTNSEELPIANEIDFFFDSARRRAVKGVISTGFTGLDKLMDGGLHSGLYVMGAITSLGKTSLALQMADNIASGGVDVLFFSLEQSRLELMSKSMSRISASLDGGKYKRAFTSRQLLSGSLPEDINSIQLLEDTKQSYRKTASRLYIREGMTDINVADIRRAAEEHRTRHSRSPVIIVDYLQILRPSDSRATDKQNVDRSVVELKRLSRDMDIPVIAISSFNRENYRVAVSMEAFKESGAVEYSSDVLFGLQLAGAGEKDFDANKAKSREPRKLELVILKNRNGLPYAKIPLEYRAKFSMFTEK